MEQGKQVLENVFFRKAAQNCTKIGENIKKRTVSLQSDFSWGMGAWKDTFQLSQLESQVLVQYLLETLFGKQGHITCRSRGKVGPATHAVAGEPCELFLVQCGLG